MKQFIFLIFLVGGLAHAQEDDILKAQEEALKESTNLTYEGNHELTTNKFIEAEVDYRKAISKSDKNAVAPYNLGNAYYNNATYSEAFGRFKQAGEKAVEKTDKHKAYHNMGNVFMKRKEYEKAVEAYKQALRNDPKDEETRYNLALAKEMLKKDQQNQDQNKDDKNEDKKDKEDKKEGDNKEENKDQQDKGDEGDQKKENEEENKEGEGDKKEDEKKKPEEGDEKKEQQRRPNQLSKQQVQNLLEAMQQEEKKVQEKIDAKKVKGVKVKNEKDW